MHLWTSVWYCWMFCVDGVKQQLVLYCNPVIYESLSKVTHWWMGVVTNVVLVSVSRWSGLWWWEVISPNHYLRFAPLYSERCCVQDRMKLYWYWDDIVIPVTRSTCFELSAKVIVKIAWLQLDYQLRPFTNLSSSCFRHDNFRFGIFQAVQEKREVLENSVSLCFPGKVKRSLFFPTGIVIWWSFYTK